MSDPYALLGVDSDADAAAIRAAYLRLIKQAHPDLADEQAAAQASAINEAYAVLRDPQRRAAYARERRARRGATVIHHGGGAGFPRLPRRPRQRVGRIALLLLGLAGLSAALVVAVQPSGPLPARLSEDEPQAQDVRGNVWVDPAMVDRGVELAAAMVREVRASDIERYSRACFRELETEPSLLRADHCIAFDVAAALLQGEDGTFGPGVQRRLEAKHKQALLRAAVKEDWVDVRLREIVSATASALVRTARPTPVAPAGAGTDG